MVRQIINRLLWLAPVLVILMVLLFVVDQQTTQDQLAKSSMDKNRESTAAESAKLANALALEKGWHLPPFYFGIHNRGWHPSMYLEVNPARRKMINDISRLTLNAKSTQRISEMLFSSLDQIRYGNSGLPESWQKLFTRYDRFGDFQAFWTSLSKRTKLEQAPATLETLVFEINTINQDKNILAAWPTFYWHGSKNRFHRFFSEYFISGSLRSNVDGKTIYKKIVPAISITLFINIISLILIILIGIPLGVKLFQHKSSVRDGISRTILYILFALPMFWIATLVLSGASYAPVLGLTGTPQLNAGETPTVFTFLRLQNLTYLILPILSIVLALLAYIAVHVERSLIETNEKKFILAARTRGLNEIKITKSHNRPVAFYSILTLIGNSIPGLISGSIVIELIFNIPGMGRLLWQSLYAYDWNVVNGILIFGIVFSIVGQLLTDLAYHYFNPSLRSIE